MTEKKFDYNSYKDNLTLVNEISSGKVRAWNIFVEYYSDIIMSTILKWCKSKCSIISEEDICEIKQLKSKNKLPEEIGNTCDQGVELYVYIFEKLRDILPKYKGNSLLGTFIVGCINKTIIKNYFIEKYGRINIPKYLDTCDDIDKQVFKIICKSSSLESVIQKGEVLELGKDEILASYNKIISILKKENKNSKDSTQDKVWVHVSSKLLKNSKLDSLIQTNEDGEESEYEIESNDQDYELKEFIEVFEKSLKSLSGKRKRLLELKFKKGESIKLILELYGDFFGFKTENEVYYEIKKALLELIQLLRDKYSDNKFFDKVDLKSFQESLEDFFAKFSNMG